MIDKRVGVFDQIGEGSGQRPTWGEFKPFVVSNSSGDRKVKYLGREKSFSDCGWGAVAKFLPKAAPYGGEWKVKKKGNRKNSYLSNYNPVEEKGGMLEERQQ